MVNSILETKNKNWCTESEHGIFNAILRGHIDFTSDPWPSISPQAKDLVRKMLNSDPKQRLTAVQVLSKCALVSSILNLYEVINM